MREMGPSFVTVAAQGFYRSRVRNCYPLPKIRPSAFGRWPYFWASPARRAGTNLLDGVQEVLPGVVHGVTHVLHGAAHAGLHGPLPG